MTAPAIADQDEDSISHLRFEAARIETRLTVADLWVRYLAAGGHCDIFDVDAHLHGVLELECFERDTLAYALNERIDELAAAAHITYLNPGVDSTGSLQEIITELLDEGRDPTSET